MGIMSRSFLSFILLFLANTLLSQDRQTSDSLAGQGLEEVVVTATRTERKLGNVAVPVTIVGQKTIRQSGSLRLHDILGEQTGLFITQGFGRGLQMQGLSSDYTLILLDGEPLIGRVGGVLDLSRLTVGNIRKIEIVKGPSSSLYGSEALAGVVNIITDRSGGRRLRADLRYGRFQTTDASIDAGTRLGKFTLGGFMNSNATNGYSLLPNAIQQTVEPSWRLTGQYNVGYEHSDNTRFGLGLRFARDEIQNSILVQNLGNQVLSKGTEVNRDINLTPTVSHRINERLKTTLRGYVSDFRSVQDLSVKGSFGAYNDRFSQQFRRVENQTDIHFSERLNLSAGGGLIRESVRSNRYDSSETRRDNDVAYFFLQQEWRPADKLTLIGGLRYDDNTAYASVWSPKFALQYRMNEKLRFNLSVGRGFKAPDFRQLYLNFTNIAAGSYSVFGSLVAADEIKRLSAAGQIDQVLPAFGRLADLRPETSTGINMGLQFDPSRNWNLRVNLFRNDVSNLILTDIIAYKKNGGQIFSYLNISRVFTQGGELEASWQFRKGMTLSGGYQYLMTADKDVLDDIKAGKVFMRDLETGLSSRLTARQYAGLPGRSKHMLNLKFFLESQDQRWFANTRLIYRSRWGVSDLDGNGIINRADEFARGHVVANMAGGRNFRNGIRVMAGVDNIFNYKDPVNLPGQPGANWFVSLSVDPFSQLRSNNSTNHQKSTK
jgi:outer membrane receptor for ferrienterochelin and colicins